MVDIKNKQGTLYFLYLLIIAAILISPYVGRFAIGFALFVFCVGFFVLERQMMFVLLFGILPVATIFKFTPTSLSMLTVCEILLFLYIVIEEFFKEKCINNKYFLLLLLVLVLYILIFGFTGTNMLSLIKMGVRFALIYFFFQYKAPQNKKDENAKNIAIVLAFGMIISMCLAQLPSYREAVGSYLRAIYYSGGDDTLRVGGLIGDPNYCSMVIMASLSFLAVLYYFKKITFEFWVLAVPLFVLGFTTYSKSYFLCAMVFLIVLEIFVLIPGHRFIALCLIVIGIVVAPMAISGQFEIINLIIDRFTSVDITTGRADLNELYLSYIGKSSFVMMFGEGYSVERLSGFNNVHNIYIEFIFRLGIVGTILYFVTLFSCFPRLERGTKFVSFLPLAFVLIMYFALAGVERFELLYHIILCGCAIFNIRKSHDINRLGD